MTAVRNCPKCNATSGELAVEVRKQSRNYQYFRAVDLSRVESLKEDLRECEHVHATENPKPYAQKHAFVKGEPRPMPEGSCVQCGRPIAVNKDGRRREHRTKTGQPCTGSGLRAEALR